MGLVLFPLLGFETRFSFISVSGIPSINKYVYAFLLSQGNNKKPGFLTVFS